MSCLGWSPWPRFRPNQPDRRRPNPRIPVRPSRWSGHAHTRHQRSPRRREPAAGERRRLVAVVGLEVAVVHHLPTPPNIDNEARRGVAWPGLHS